MKVFRSLLIKEARALLPLWAACVAALVVHVLVGNGLTESVALLAYVLGTSALGAYAIGEELSHRTFSLQLVQPISRHRLFIPKWLVLALMLTALGALGWFATVGRRPVAPPSELAVLPVLAGLFVAPWLTLLTRNPLAGLVFPLAAAAILFAALQYVAPAFVADDPLLAGSLNPTGPALAAAAARWTFIVWSRAMFALSAVAAVLCWRTFMRFEIIDGQQGGIHLPRWFAADDTLRTPGALSRLVRKEIYLQQMTLAFVVLYVGGWFALSASLTAAARDDAFVGLTVMYAMTVALVAGSLASAEERNVGMLETQRLLPVAAWQQWIIKVAATFAVVAVTAVGVPVLLALATGLSVSRSGGFEVPLALGGMVVVVTTISLYVSSLSNSGTKAVGFAFLAFAGAAGVLNWTLSTVFRNAPNVLANAREAMWLSGGTLVLLLCVFAALNHNSSERRPARIALQLGVAIAVIPVCSFLTVYGPFR